MHLKHPSLTRTSKKGEPFVGFCPSCGEEDIELKDINTVCNSPISYEEALMGAINDTD